MNKTSVNFGEIWEQVIVGEGKSFACFSHGTCVIFTEPQQNLRDAAVALMKSFGPVHAGSSAGDFSVMRLDDRDGWVVTSHHNDILTYVDAKEAEFDADNDIIIGLYGRDKRQADADQLNIIHMKQADGYIPKK